MIILNKYKVTNMKRFKMFLIISTFLLCFITFMILLSFTRVYSVSNSIFDTVIVREGDTLWGIANNYSEKSCNINKFIYEIRKANNISDATIYPGQELLIPLK